MRRFRHRRLAARLGGIAALGLAAALGGMAACGDGAGDPGQSASAKSRGGEQRPARFAPPARFGPLPAGWRQFNNGGAMVTSRGATAESFATSWRFDQSSRRGPAGDMPPGGIIVHVMLIRRAAGGRPSAGLCRGAPPLAQYPRIRRLPLRIPDSPAGTLEGYDGVPEYQIFGSVRNDYHVEVRVDINAPSPSRKLLRQAQQALNVLRLPDWPNHC